MAVELCGVPLDRFEGPIQHALRRYQEISADRLKFDNVSASRLELTPEKPNSARSAVSVKYMEENVGTLYVIAFKPQDGTGDEKTHQLVELETRPYPHLPKVVPRAKTGVYAEGHLTVVTHKIEDAHAEPMLFDGSFDLLGLQRNKVLKIGTLGQNDNSRDGFKPVATLTTGYDAAKTRFSDPHAVFSMLPDRIQICAFLAITEIVNQKYQGILQMLNADYPKDLKNIVRWFDTLITNYVAWL